MSDKTVYAWRPKLARDGSGTGGMVNGEHLTDNIFTYGLKFQESIQKWKSMPGIQLAFSGKREPDLNAEVQRTARWINEQYPIPFITSMQKAKLERFDTPHMAQFIPIVSSKALQILTDYAGDCFESFPIIVQTADEPSHDYHLINITKIINPAIDRENSKYKHWDERPEWCENAIWSIKRLLLLPGCMGDIGLGRVYGKIYMPMVHQRVVDAFRKHKVAGFDYIPLEDKINQLSKSNYLPNGRLVGYEDE